MKAFITGSQIYGIPSEESDIDLVIFASKDVLDILLPESDLGHAPIKFGKLNVIVAETEQQYLAWFEGKRKCLETMALNNNEGLDKDTCIKIHDEVRKFLNVPYGNESHSDSGDDQNAKDHARARK